MTGARASSVLAVLVAALAMLVVAGCSEDDSTPTFPDRPEPEIGIWFLGVWGSGPDDVFVVGQPGLIYHWDGQAWTREESGTDVALTDVWGDGSGTVYATGHDGVLLQRQGGTWTSMDTGTDADLFGVGSYQGAVHACGRTDLLPELRVLSGGTWSAAPTTIYQRDNELAVIDTLDLASDEDPEEIIESLTTVGYYGITGADGVILMSDPEVPWQLRRILGGTEWITASTSKERVSGNFIATDGGRLFQLEQVDGERLAWAERFSPAIDATIYGLHTGDADTVWAVTNDGRIKRVDPPLYNGAIELHRDDLVLFDIWGSSGLDLYAVGIEGRVLHFTEVDGEYKWVNLELPLPELKHDAGPVFDKFGRPVR
jgi:hypothetical protein